MGLGLFVGQVAFQTQLHEHNNPVLFSPESAHCQQQMHQEQADPAGLSSA